MQKVFQMMMMVMTMIMILMIMMTMIMFLIVCAEGGEREAADKEDGKGEKST